jgi:beta-lactamase superfamily II metal-dependent hydrolase
MAPTIDYVRSRTARWDVIARGDQPPTAAPRRKALLWGDRVVVTGNGRQAGEVLVDARGQTGYVATSDLGGEPLLEVYFIDVGQGDGVLVCTPDRRHLLIDGGWPRRGQPTGKNAADFVDWKFAQDYRMDHIALDAALCSHNDQDHYGGLWDLFNPAESWGLAIPTSRVFVERFFHAGLSWWRRNGQRTLGRWTTTDHGPMFTELLGNRASVLAGLEAGAPLPLQGEWAAFLQTVVGLKTQGGAATPIARLSHLQEYLPGYERESSDVAVRVLAPVEFAVDGAPAIRRYTGGDSKNTNGNSLLLRVDYGRARILLTGDLNARSQAALLADWAGERQELQCDVAKACHHGSDDVSYTFLRALEPAVTIISSGDNEGHDHPRPAVVAASATTGYLQIENDRVVSPEADGSDDGRDHGR